MIMRRILPLILVSLAGCGSIANTEFDATEAAKYSDVGAMAEQLQQGCLNPQVVRQAGYTLQAAAAVAQHYSAVKANDARIATAGEQLLQLTVDLNTRYRKSDPSEAYCVAKLKDIESGADMIAKSIAKKELKSPIALP
jgi:uncharacterized protein YceK